MNGIIIINSFKAFKYWVKKQGDIWQTDDVFFCQTQRFYIADYRPKYPLSSPKDDCYIYDHIAKKFFSDNC